MNKSTLLLSVCSVFCLHTSLALAESATPMTHQPSLMLAQATPAGEDARIERRTERRIERRSTMAESSPEERMNLRQERRATVSNYRQTNAGAQERIDRREHRRSIRQETRGGSGGTTTQP